MQTLIKTQSHTDTLVRVNCLKCIHIISRGPEFDVAMSISPKINLRNYLLMLFQSCMNIFFHCTHAIIVRTKAFKLENINIL